jgi:hypothetical protein
MKKRASLNYKVLLVFAPLLIIIGLLGFTLPQSASPTSGTAAYNGFHLLTGAVGLIFLLARNERQIAGFNFIFGLIDLYQAAASRFDWFPKQYFRWTQTDDILHIVIGLALTTIGLYGLLNLRARKKR